MGGQGRGRTADLPLFRRTLIPTELPDRAGDSPGCAVLTGFEPAASTLTGWRALLAALQDHAYRPPTRRAVPPMGHDAEGNRLRPKENTTGMLVVEASRCRASRCGAGRPTASSPARRRWPVAWCSSE